MRIVSSSHDSLLVRPRYFLILFLVNLCLIHNDIMYLFPVAHQLWLLSALGLSPWPDKLLIVQAGARGLYTPRNPFLRPLEEDTRAAMFAPSRRTWIGMLVCVVNPSLCRCLTSIPIPNLLSANLSVIPNPGRDKTGHHLRAICLRYVSAGTSWHAFQMRHTE
jgi:hypothetical protein